MSWSDFALVLAKVYSDAAKETFGDEYNSFTIVRDVVAKKGKEDNADDADDEGPVVWPGNTYPSNVLNEQLGITSKDQTALEKSADYEGRTSESLAKVIATQLLELGMSELQSTEETRVGKLVSKRPVFTFWLTSLTLRS